MKVVASTCCNAHIDKTCAVIHVICDEIRTTSPAKYMPHGTTPRKGGGATSQPRGKVRIEKEDL